MKKLVNRRFVFKSIGVFLFVAALVFNFAVRKKDVSVQSDNKLAHVMLIASAQSEEYKPNAKYSPVIFDCYCLPDGCVHCKCGC